MKKLWLALPVLLASTVCAHHASAQTSARPADATAQCNDGSYWTGASKQGACSGHKGIKTWYGAPAGSAVSQANTSNAKPAVSGATNVRPAGSPERPSPTPKEEASGAGQKNQVWVNTATNVYHCPGDRFYGKTKDGKFMSEAAAKKAGAKPDHGNSCPTE